MTYTTSKSQFTSVNRSGLGGKQLGWGGLKGME